MRLEVSLTDGVQFLSATFFAKSQFKLAPIERLLTPGASFLFAGKVGAYRGKLQLTHPSFEGVDGEDIVRIATRPIPIYPATGKLTSWAIARAVGMVLEHLDEADVPDVVPADVRGRQRIDSYAQSLRRLHQPETDEDYQRARRALAFTEAFVLQVGLAARRRGARSTPALASPREAPLLERFRRTLPFELTHSQSEAVAQIGADLAGQVPMQRLLQGDVGSGKTVVALLALLQVIAAGHQGALVAPTEVLAEQHAASLRNLLAPLGDDTPDVRLLTGSTTPTVRREIAAAMTSNAPLIVVGTHALFQDSVRFADLALVIVDEQHRFGVEQRAALRDARQDGRGVHELVMTATPIPRTIAMTVFGDLDETRMTGMPKGRAPVATFLADAANTAWVERTWTRAAEEIAAGHRVYVVCPRIDASDTVADAEEEDTRPLASVEEVAAYLRSHPALAGLAIHELTGRTQTALPDHGGLFRRTGPAAGRHDRHRGRRRRARGDPHGDPRRSTIRARPASPAARACRARRPAFPVHRHASPRADGLGHGQAPGFRDDGGRIRARRSRPAPAQGGRRAGGRSVRHRHAPAFPVGAPR